MTAEMDDAYANSAHIEGAEKYVAAWKRDAEAFRAAAKNEMIFPYGRGKRERYDLFLPEGSSTVNPPKGLFVFIHGGYWMDFDKSFWSHLGAGAMAHGWAAAFPSYDLCPDKSITGIACQIAAAITDVASRVEGPIVISGHSAGGHLAARMVCENSPLSTEVRERIQLAVGISGIYDLAPLMFTKMNETLGIDKKEVIAESPARLAPMAGVKFVAWVGGDERPEFLRQTRELAQTWSGTKTFFVEEAGKHHFDIIDGLCDPESRLVLTALGL